MEAANEAYFEREARLRGALEEGYPDAWKPQTAGETLVGIFRGRETGTTVHGPKWIVTIEDGTGKRWAVWLLHVVLENRFRRAEPAIGDMVAIRYDGKAVPEGGGDEYHNWAVRVERPESATVDWSTPPPKSASSSFSNASNSSATGDDIEQPPPVDEDIPF